MTRIGTEVATLARARARVIKEAVSDLRVCTLSFKLIRAQKENDRQCSFSLNTR